MALDPRDFASVFGAPDPMGMTPEMGKLIAESPESLIPAFIQAGIGPEHLTQLASNDPNFPAPPPTMSGLFPGAENKPPPGQFGGYATQQEQQQAEANKTQFGQGPQNYPVPPPAPGGVATGIGQAIESARGGRPSPYQQAPAAPPPAAAAPAPAPAPQSNGSWWPSWLGGGAPSSSGASGVDESGMTGPWGAAAPLVPQAPPSAPAAATPLPQPRPQAANAATTEASAQQKKASDLVSALAGVKAPPAPPPPQVRPSEPRGQAMPQSNPLIAMLANIMSGQSAPAQGLLRLGQTIGK